MNKLPAQWALENERIRTSESDFWAQRVLSAPTQTERTARLAQVPPECETAVVLALVSTYRVRLLSLKPRGLWKSHGEAVFAEIPTPVQPLVREAITRSRGPKPPQGSGG